jgi:hypothetical protein
MFTKNDSEYSLWNIILTSAKKFHGKCHNGNVLINVSKNVLKITKMQRNAKKIVII